MGAGGCDDGLSGSMVGVDGGRGRNGSCGERDDERGGGGVVFGWEDGGRGTVGVLLGYKNPLLQWHRHPIR